MTGAAVITAALTGPIASKSEHPRLPTSAEEIASEAQAAWQAGASVVHLHLRDDAGLPTADPAVAERVVAAVSAACPALVQLSTGVGLGVAFDERAALVEVRPAMATLNVCSMTFGEGEFSNPPDAVRRLAARMLELGVKPELELYDTGHLEVALSLRAEGLLSDPLQFSLVLGVRGGMPASPESILQVVGRLPSDAVWQVIGIGRHNLPMAAIGLVMGGNARTGMEDTLMVRRGVPTAGNGELVERLAGLVKQLDRPIADVPQTQAILGLA